MKIYANCHGCIKIERIKAKTIKKARFPYCWTTYYNYFERVCYCFFLNSNFFQLKSLLKMKTNNYYKLRDEIKL